jgi:hypothetical protein
MSLTPTSLYDRSSRLPLSGGAGGPVFFLSPMISRFLSALALLFALGAAGCEEAGLAPRDSSPIAPGVSNPGVSPSTVNIDSLTPSGGIYEITLTVSATATDADGQGDLVSVRAEAIRPGGGAAFIQGTLHDDGVSPDLASGDSIFTGTLVIRTTRSQAGVYRIRCIAQDRATLRSRGVEAACFVTRNNTPPAIDSLSLSAPDTLVRPASGSLLFRVSIAAGDSDGLGDIGRVFMENLATLTRFTLLDDGGTAQTGGITSGDSLAGDGIFTITFGLPSSAPAGILHYRLQALDAAQDTSRSVPYTLVIE